METSQWIWTRVESLGVAEGLKSVWGNLLDSTYQHTSSNFRILGAAFDWKLNWNTLLLRVGRRGGRVAYDPWDCICFENSKEGQRQVQEKPQGHMVWEGHLPAAYLIMRIVKKQGCSEKLVGMRRRRLEGPTVWEFLPTSLSIPLLWLPGEVSSPSFISPSDLMHLKRWLCTPICSPSCTYHCGWTNGMLGSPHSPSVLFKSGCSWMSAMFS